MIGVKSAYEIDGDYVGMSGKTCRHNAVQLANITRGKFCE